jgi:transcriptional regulator with XRE-family HTH domain
VDASNASKLVSQQNFLRDAMQRLDMTRDQFAARLGASRRRLDNWLLPSDSAGFRELDPVIGTFVREILEREGQASRSSR